VDGALSKPLFRESGDKYHLYVEPLGDKSALQLKAVEARHMDVGYQARGFREAARSEEILNGFEGPGLIAKRLDEVCYRLSHHTIVVDNRDKRHLLLVI